MYIVCIQMYIFIYVYILQEGESIGSSILQLVVTDKDTPKNGPPFSFHIVSGNTDRRFHVDQGGLLSLSAPLRKKNKPYHQLKIQVKKTTEYLFLLCFGYPSVCYLSSELYAVFLLSGLESNTQSFLSNCSCHF